MRAGCVVRCAGGGGGVFVVGGFCFCFVWFFFFCLVFLKHAFKSKRRLGAAGEATASHFSRSPDWRPLRDLPEADAEIAGLPLWNAKTALQTWTLVRGLFGAGLARFRFFVS